jgi:hypothetical protein
MPRRPAEPRYVTNDKARRKVQPGVWRVDLGGSTVLARCRAGVSILISSTPQRRRLERFVVWLHGGRLGQAKDLYHTVKSHSVANSGTNSGCSISRDSVACGSYPILEYHFFRNSLLG